MTPPMTSYRDADHTFSPLVKVSKRFKYYFDAVRSKVLLMSMLGLATLFPPTQFPYPPVYVPPFSYLQCFKQDFDAVKTKLVTLIRYQDQRLYAPQLSFHTPLVSVPPFSFSSEFDVVFNYSSTQVSNYVSMKSCNDASMQE